ncbi:hypothetical protein Tco_0726334 [Tanacetum coccineum]|uniref:Uncharacterized protein n=1 Tax=Tanacetum coccineum TaxID=301880 RepID=A0ABQ4YFB7_9ASTR
MRNIMFMHTARDDSLLGTMRFVSRHVDTQVYGAILPEAMTNRALLDSVAYMTYYAITLGAEPLKSRKRQKKSDLAIGSEESPSKKNGSCDATDFELRVPDEQHRKTSSTYEGTDAMGDVMMMMHNVDDVQKIAEYYEEEEDMIDDEEMMDEEKDDETTKCFSRVGFEASRGDVHVSTYISSFLKLISKLLNLENPSLADNEIASLMDTTVRHKEPRVINLEKDPSEIKQVDQYSQALSFIPAIVDRYIDNTLGEA